MASRVNRASVLGLFATADGAADGVDALNREGFTGQDFEILTDSPYPEGAFGEAPTPHKLYVFPLAGATCGFSVGVLITVGTQLAFPMVTGGKPLVSIPPIINILYEGTMLGALLFTVIGIVFESRLPRIGLGVYDRRIMSEGLIGVLVSSAQDRLGSAEKALRGAGAVDVVSGRPSGGQQPQRGR